jgi:hypothetical protein
VVGIKGNYKEAAHILAKITEFCAQIGLTVNQDKSKITFVISDKAKFLDTYITRSHHIKFISRNGINVRQSINLLFLAPMDKIRQKLKIANFLKNGKTHPKFL